jgi:hypothetical protein
MTRCPLVLLALWLPASGCALLLQYGPEIVTELRGGPEYGRRAPVDPAEVGTLRPTQKDRDAGLVGIASGFDLKGYSSMAVERFVVPGPAVSGGADDRIGEHLASRLQSDLVTDLRRYGRRLFRTVVSADEPAGRPTAAGRVLKLQGSITTLAYSGTEATVQVETRFVDGDSGQVVMVTATRRAQRGDDAQKALSHALYGVRVDLLLYLERLRAGDAPRGG